MTRFTTRSSDHPAPSGRRRWLRPVAVLFGLTVLAGAGWATFFSPQACYWLAQRALPDNPDQALELLERAVSRADNDYPAAQLLWTQTLLRAGRWQEALGCFSLIPEPSRLDDASLLELADEARERNSPLLASLALEVIHPGSPHRADAVRRLLVLRQQQGNWPAVITLARELSIPEPENPQVWLALATALESLGSPPDAADAWRRFLQHAEELEQRRPALLNLLKLCIELGERDEARSLLNELQATNRSAALPDEVRLLEARLLRLEGDLESAGQSVQAFLDEHPEDALARELHGTLAMDRRDYELARDVFETLCRQQPWNKQAHYRLAQCLQHLGHTEDARLHFHENKRLTDLSIRVLDLQSKVLEGRAEIERLQALATAYEQLGQTVTAERFRQHARQLSLTSP